MLATEATENTEGKINGFINRTDHSGSHRGSSYPGARLIGIDLRRSSLL